MFAFDLYYISFTCVNIHCIHVSTCRFQERCNNVIYMKNDTIMEDKSVKYKCTLRNSITSTGDLKQN